MGHKNLSKNEIKKKQKNIFLSNKGVFYNKKPVWSFSKCDIDHPKWGFSASEDLYFFIQKLKTYEGLSWIEIMQASGGRRSGTNNHFEPVSELIPEAIGRWKELRLEDYDQIFSLRLTGMQRLYGILEEGIFFIVWYDRSHEIYPMKK